MVTERPSRKLLVVDDEPLVRQTLSFVLQDEYEIVAVGSGEEAVAASEKEDFPVVILDLCMQGLSGIETLQRLKKLRESQNVIVLTAYESTETAIDALNLGAFNYLTKPFERVHLKRVVARGFDLYEQSVARKEDLQQRLMGVHDTFFSLLCHEFNTPLNVILGFSDLLSTTTDDPEHTAWVSHIREAGTHLHDILMEIVDYTAASHLATAGIERPFVPREIFRPALLGYAEKGVTVEFADGAAARARCHGPAEAVAMIAKKLVRMAAQRSPRVRLSVEIEDQDGPHLKMVVGGTGIRRDGLNGRDLEQLFQPYEVVTHDDSACAMSLGLELATCRKIADYAHAVVEGKFDAHGELELISRIPVHVLS